MKRIKEKWKSMTKEQKLMGGVSILLVVALVICSFKVGEKIGAKKEAEAIQEAEEAEPITYTYMDANGNFHTFDLDQTAEKTAYDISKFTLDGTSIYDMYGAIYDGDLSGETVDTSDTTKYPETTGVDGTHNGYLDAGTVSYDDDAYTTRMGIDVSYHQGDIDWEQVAEAGYEFVYIRVGFRGYADEGSLNIDEKFVENIAGAKAAGLDVGVYFFSQAVSEEEAVEEAEYVLDALGDTTLELPVVFDPETIGSTDARTYGVSGAQFTRNTLAFCSAIQEAGYESAVYANMVWEDQKLDMTSLSQADIPVWYADYEPLAQTPYAYYCWQYSASGTVPGIDGVVDLDLEITKVE